tara:strand:+ start:633 stop:920 length:288 start_codon:yes stop_codon:yes gene_type:complete
MSRFGDLLRGGPPAPKVEATPVPEPVVEESPVVVENPDESDDIEATKPDPEVELKDMTKKELEEYGRTIGVELDRRRSKETLIGELREAIYNGDL